MSQLDRLEAAFGTGRQISIHEITDILWSHDPEGGPLDTTNNIQQHLFRLRRQRNLNIRNVAMGVYQLDHAEPRLTQTDRVAEHFKQNPGKLITIRNLTALLWGNDPDGGPLCTTQKIYNCISKIRKDPGKYGLRIVTDGYRGYRMEVDHAMR